MLKHWSELGPKPNSPAAERMKTEALSTAGQLQDVDRTSYLQALCTDKRVLDIGCGGHDVSAISSDGWLHGQLVAVADTCVGVESNAEAVSAMTAAGLNVLNADVCDPASAEALANSVDVVVAGEVIEHLASPQALFDFAAVVLVPGGRLVITTPNPYAPWRVRRGRRLELWENLDHVIYAFPSGILELASRTGFTLEELGSTKASTDLRKASRVALTAPLRRLRGKRGDDVGILGAYYPPRYVSPLEIVLSRVQGGFFLGETAVYLLRLDTRSS